MATNLKEVNYSGEKLTVGAIEILGDITGGGIKTVRRAISDLAETVQTVAAETSDYWTAIASDLTITPTEKKQLKKEWNAITMAYSSICESAKNLNLNDYTEIKNYKATYTELYNYIFTTIKIFDNMAENTVIPSSETFNSLYASYYDDEAKANQRIAIGQVDEDSGIRTISNLSVVGYDGEVAIYRNCFYQYSTSKNTWTELNTGVLYMGAFNYQPEGELNHFFLCYEETPYKAKLVINGSVLANENSQKIIANLESFEAGYIYYYGSGGNWKKVTNKNDWRYIVAMNDLIKYGFQVSEYVDEYIQGTAHTACYLGALSTFPEEGNYKAGDWFMWAGATQESEKVPTGKLVFGSVYKYIDPTWALLDPTEKTAEGFLKYSTEFMESLNDILTSKQAGEGYFSTVFCNALISNSAFIEKLAASIIKLQEDSEGNKGVIYGGERYNSDGSDKDVNATGFYLDTEGNLKAQNAELTGKINSNLAFFKKASISDSSFDGTVTTNAFTTKSTITTEYNFFKNTHYDLTQYSWFEEGTIIQTLNTDYDSVIFTKSTPTHYVTYYIVTFYLNGEKVKSILSSNSNAWTDYVSPELFSLKINSSTRPMIIMSEDLAFGTESDLQHMELYIDKEGNVKCNVS